jgi:hypothetical protein
VLSPTPNPTATGKLLKIRQLKQYSVVPSGLLSPFLWRFSAGLTHPRPSTPCQSPSASSTTTGLRREHVPHLTSLHTTFIALVSPVTSSGLAASEKMRCVACVVCAGPETGVGWPGQRQVVALQVVWVPSGSGSTSASPLVVKPGGFHFCWNKPATDGAGCRLPVPEPRA